MLDHNSTEGILRKLNREIWIVTASAADRRGGLVATWVSPASIDARRPVLLAGIAPNHFTCELIDASNAFAVHLIKGSQVDLAWTFALGSGRNRDKFAGVDAGVAQTGSPILADCLAWLDCQVIARLDMGDRIFFWGEVVASAQVADGLPLCERELLEAAGEEQLRQLREERENDVALQRPVREAWLRRMPELLKPAGPS